MEIHQGDIFTLEGDIARTILVISNDIMNQKSPTIIVLAITSIISEAKLPSHVALKAEDYNLKEDSIVLGEQVRTINKDLLKEKLSRLDEKMFKRVEEAFAFNTFVDAAFFEKVNISRIDFVKGKHVPFKEDYDNEFKEITADKDYEAIKDQIKKTVVPYACAFLNNGGGRLLFGIKDDGEICGFTLPEEKKDELIRAINNSLHDSIFPKLNTLNFRLELHEVLTPSEEAGYYDVLEDECVLEILVYPPLDSSTVYYEGSYKIWTKLNAQKGQALKNTEITDFIVRKALLKK
jgi:mRNA interferase MazF